MKKNIETEWIVSSGDPISVSVPDINAISGDKLTAFAPETTGVPYYRTHKNKEGTLVKSEMFMEIIKQSFDVGCLFDRLDSLETFKKAFYDTVISEIKYRPERNISHADDILRDVINTSLIIARSNVQADKTDSEKFNMLKKGIDQFGHYVYSGSFRIEEAQLSSAKAAYLAAILLANKKDVLKFDENNPLSDYLITHPSYNFLNKRLKFVAKGEALFYWYQIIELLYN